MELSDIFLKMANGARLTPNELDNLSRFGAETQQRNSLVAGNVITGQAQLNIPNPFVPIFDQTLTTSTASISAVVPSNVKHLFCIGTGRCTGATSNELVIGRFNGDSGNNYDWNYEGAQAAVQTAAQSKTQSSFSLGYFTAASATSGAEGSFFAFMPHIQSSTLWKGVLSLSACSEFSATDLNSIFFTGHWRSTSAALTLSILANASNFAAGTVFSIYGLA